MRTPAPTHRRVAIPPAPAKSWMRPPAAGRAAAAPSPADVAAEEQAWDEAMHQAASLARAQGKLPGAVEETVRGAHVEHRRLADIAPTLHDRRREARLYSWSVPNRRFIDSGLYLPSIRSEGIDHDRRHRRPPRARCRPATLAAFWTELREIATELQPERVILLQVDAAVQDAAEYAASDLPDEIAVRGQGRDRLPAGLRLARRERYPTRRLPLPHRHAVFELPRDRARILRCRSGSNYAAAARRLEPRALGRAHRHRNLFGGPRRDPGDPWRPRPRRSGRHSTPWPGSPSGYRGPPTPICVPISR